jgi:hypothetical protein
MTKSALGIDPAEYGVTDPLHAWRIRTAQREAERRELVMLRKEPDRRFFLRKPIPFEGDGWVADEHKGYTLVLVRVMVESNQFHRMMIKAGPSTVIDTEDFCRALYFQACPATETGSGSTIVSVEQHAKLIEAAGIRVTRGEEEQAHD